MGPFSFFASLLVLLAIAFAVSALWQRSRLLALAIALALPVAAGALYWAKGTPAALDPANTTPPNTIDEAIAQLERLTKADPNNYSDQATLARAYMAAGKYAQAREAYARTLAMKPAEHTYDVEYAEAMLRNSPDRRFPPEAVKLLEGALAADPRNQRALFFLGLHQRQSGQPAAAVATWERLLALLDAQTSTELRKQIAAARKEAGMPALPVEATIEIEVRIDPTLARELHPGSVLFVFARTADGEGPPVAAKRVVAEHFPVQVELGDADSPMPAAKLFSQKSVVLMARLSKSGDARPASGDLESDPIYVDVAPGAKAQLVIGRSLP
jgi:cytochrome c-type biogenesis protein CcmH